MLVVMKDAVPGDGPSSPACQPAVQSVLSAWRDPGLSVRPGQDLYGLLSTKYLDSPRDRQRKLE